MGRISINEVRSLLDSGQTVTVVDSRSDNAWASSDEKAAGAIRIPLDEAHEHLDDLTKDRPIVVYCT
jgi:rhodanese-related sulfurtransferase